MRKCWVSIHLHKACMYYQFFFYNKSFCLKLLQAYDNIISSTRTETGCLQNGIFTPLITWEIVPFKILQEPSGYLI